MASPSVSHSQVALSLQVSLPQMLDLALGTPEVGAVNLNILHNFLHVLLHQIDLRSTKVEYRGEEANRIKSMIGSSKVGSSLVLHEYNIIDATGNTIQRSRRSETGINADVYTDLGKSGKGGKPGASAPVTARRKSARDGSEANVDDGNGATAAKKTSGLKQQIGSGMESERQSVIFVEPVLNGVTPTALGFKRLEDSVKELQQKFQALDELANNPEMIERVKNSKSDPLSDMWHGINVSKRLDASEQVIEKLTTMIQDLIKSDKIETTGEGNITEKLGFLDERIVELENHLAYLGGDVSKLKVAIENRDEDIFTTKNGHETPLEREDTGSKTTLATRGETEERSETIKKISSTKEQKDDTNSLYDQMMSNKTEKKQSSSITTRRSVIGGVDLTELKDEVKALKDEMNVVQKNLQNLNTKIVDNATDSDVVTIGIDDTRRTIGDTSKTASANGTIAARSAVSTAKEMVFDEISVKSQKTMSKSSVNRGLRDVGKDRTPSHVNLGEGDDEKRFGDVEAVGIIKELDLRVKELEKKMAQVIERINSEFAIEKTSGINDLVTKIQTIQADMEKINETASRLMEDKENRDTHTDALVEQIELLKTIKADKEDLEEALADKADAQAVNRKVSHDQFDSACEDLTRGLEDAITKLTNQESIWQQALDEVQREIEGKLDKIEISPLKEFVNERLKLLQEKLKALAEMRRENEAAGTKKMLSDVQCISCDANVVMRMEEGVHYRAPAMPSSKSIKPYLTYELDQVRKQQRRLPHSRNMIQFEAALQEMTRKAKPLKEDLMNKSPRDHLCNRYCGGSHTITTPQQRVMRMGHFLTQWGPEAIQLSEGVVLGNDGQLYRSRAMPEKQKNSCDTCCDGESVEIHSSSQQIPEAAPISHRHSQMNQRRSNTSQVSKRLSARKPSERMKETVEPKIEEIPVEPNTPPSAPPGTIIDEGDAIPEPSGSTNRVVRERQTEGENQTPEEFAIEENSEKVQKA